MQNVIRLSYIPSHWSKARPHQENKLHVEKVEEMISMKPFDTGHDSPDELNGSIDDVLHYICITIM